MSNYEEIKNLIRASRQAFNANLNEEDQRIKKQYGLLTEQPVEKEEEIFPIFSIIFLMLQ